jgi:hypothetical protein
MDNYPQARLMNLPQGVKGFVCHDDDGEAIIVLNSRLSREQNKKTYAHERKHISRGDMYDTRYKEYEGETEGRP